MSDDEVEIDPLKPPFCRQGNKYTLRNRIIPLFPEHTTYVEPFAGSSAIFFNKPKAEKNVLNDLDKQTIESYKILKKAPLEREKYRQDLNTLPKLKRFFDNHSDSVADQLFYNKIRTCNGFSGLPANMSNRIYKAFNPIKMLDLLDEYQDKLRGVVLSNQDYEKVIKKYDSPTTLFFIDPPYEETFKNFGYAEDEGFDFDRLAEVLRGIKGHFLMTINNSPRIRKIFREFHQKPVKVQTGWGNMSQSKKGQFRKELFIANFKMGRIPPYEGKVRE